MFSLLFSQRVPILFWWQITQSIFCAGVGIAIIGGLYWKKGTTAAAWGATIVGALLSGGGILLLYCWPHFVTLSLNIGLIHSTASLPEEFPLNFMWVSLLAAAISVAVYVLVSLATSKSNFDLDAMLHRDNGSALRVRVRRSLLKRVAQFLGFDENFTFWDKFVTATLFIWSVAWLLITVGGSVWNSIAPWPTEWWLKYWMVAGIGIPIAVATITFVWFGIGSVFDLRDFFHTLRTTKRNLLDDGSVDVQQQSNVPRTDEPPEKSGEAALSKDYCPRV
jgi:solute:Na+ symporter, SSS family